MKIDQTKKKEIFNYCSPYIIAEIGANHNGDMDLAKKISEKSQAVLKIGKEAFYKQSQLNIEDAYEYTSMVMTKNMMIDDASEGISSFLDKRNPKWKNK